MRCSNRPHAALLLHTRWSQRSRVSPSLQDTLGVKLANYVVLPSRCAEAVLTRTDAREARCIAMGDGVTATSINTEKLGKHYCDLRRREIKIVRSALMR